MSDAINPDHYKRLPAEAIEIIEAAIDGSPSNQDAYLHGQVLKYILRCWNKNGIEDLKKAKWYLDRLIEHCDLRESLLDISNGLVKAWACENGKAKQVCPEQLQPPDGWRWLERGELIRNGDKPVNGVAIPLLWIGTPCCGEEFILRRNRFEVGEKVVDCRTGLVRTVQGTDKQYSIVFFRGFPNGIESKHLTPYIEDAK